MEAPQAVRILKRDAFGRVERLEGSFGVVVRRVACGSSVVGSRTVARFLLRKERRALLHLDGQSAVPSVLECSDAVGAVSPGEGAPDPREVLVRSWIEAVPLWKTETLPRDYFDRLEALVRELHDRGVCHNDLHKEPNILVCPDGSPALVDFQLASVHPTGGRRFRVRVAEDLRHVAKHRARYVRAMEEGGVHPGAGAGRHASLVARAWMRAGKPVYNRLTGRFGSFDGDEPRRPREGPWPTWVGS